MPRQQPKSVLKLLNDAQARVQEQKVEAEVLTWLRKLVAGDKAARDARGDNGTRKDRR